MRALTLHQPWATLVALGVKTIETRSWRAPVSLIGQHVAIHAGAKQDHDALFRLDAVFHDHGFCFTDDERFPLGAIVATARLVDCVPMVERDTGIAADRYLYVMNSAEVLDIDMNRQPRIIDTSDQLPYGDFAPGRWAWLLDDVKPTTERCPACMGEGIVDGGPSFHDPLGGAVACETCNTDGTCPPAPAKGRQGLWTWSPSL